MGERLRGKRKVTEKRILMSVRIEETTKNIDIDNVPKRIRGIDT
jgi:hypothetical protein